MIIKGLFNLIYNFLAIILTPFEIIPNVPSQVDSYFNSFLDFIFAPISIVSYLFPTGFIMVVIPVFLVIVNMEHIWDGIMWILKKLPFVGIE